ncbi:MAG: TrkA family potassium uptake protein [Deltaproteobacteria bacterium]|jgi:trk system potassium uptake protein TrkA|nr:TrkA family potassium uptake protein [Deltaproteobacteria bacterium]
MKQYAVLGLGNFGFYLASRLYEKGHEVLAVDKDQTRVQDIRDKVSQAVVADTTDRRVMENLGVRDLDAAVVCIGSVLSDSILTVLNLKEIGVKQVIAKAISEPHGRILRKIGASEILFPEKDMAISLAERLHNPNLIEYLPVLEGFSIIQLAPPNEFIGKSLRELNLINRYGVQVVAIKELVPERLNMIPTAKFILKDSDIMILLGPNKALEKLRSHG